MSTPLPGLEPLPFATRRARAALGTRALDFRHDDERARERLTAALGLEPGFVVRAQQIHGPLVVAVEGPRPAVPDADGLATRAAGLALLALGADCPGIAVLADDVPAVAVAHSGWRGAVRDVGPRAVEALVALGAARAGLRAFVGPGIGPCCFEVGDEVVAAFEDAHGPLGTLVRRGPGGKPHVDLKGAIARRLVERGGLRPEDVQVSPECTRCARERFFSRRGEGPGCGHHALVAWIAP